MDTRRPLAIKMLAMVSGFLLLWPILFDLYFAFAILGQDSSFGEAFLLFRIVFDLSYLEIVEMILWTGLIVCLLKESRWSLIFSVLLSALAAVGLIALAAVSGSVFRQESLTGPVIMAIVVALAPFFILEATFRLWRKGALK